jgi:Flp pilus assembly protein TadD
MMRTILVAVSALAIAAPALADENTGYRSIAAGNLKEAETRLMAALRADPGRPEVLLNLAAVYAKTDRPAAARDLYRRVLSTDATLMDMPSGATISSHTVAQRGLARIEPAQIASR